MQTTITISWGTWRQNKQIWNAYRHTFWNSQNRKMRWVHGLQGIMNYLFFSHLIFVITWDQISPGDRSFCTVSLRGGGMMWAQKMMRNQRDKNKVSCHTDSFNETKSCFAALLIYSFINEDSGRENTAIHTDIDVNKFYLPTFSNTSNCQTQGGSLSQERSTLWISLSHVPLEDSPLVPIANIKVKYSWKQGVQVLVTYLKICLHWHQNWSRPVRGA